MSRLNKFLSLAVAFYVQVEFCFFVRAASRIPSLLITKTTVIFSFFSRSVAVQSIMDVKFCLCFLVILVIAANANVIKDRSEYEGVASGLEHL